MKKTKILCTIGPASSSEKVIRAMIENGMNAARINTSHGDFDQYKKIIQTIRSIENIPILMDTQGPKVRLRMPKNRTIMPGEEMWVEFVPGDGNYLDADIRKELRRGDRALIDDGTFDACIVEKDDSGIRLKFKNGGELFKGKAVNFPQKALPLPPLTEKDHHSLSFAREMDVDYMALSFTRGKEDIFACRSYLKGSPVKVIAKIENQQGIDNFEEILDNADGIMIARGDMGVELSPEEVPFIQKKLIRTCCTSDLMGIIATQMLQSMIENPRPTRAEISDVANAILDGADMVMLSGETATGQYPVEVVSMMARICKSAEPHVDVQQPSREKTLEAALCESIRTVCRSIPISKIISITRRGHTAKLISRLRMQQEILALTSEISILRELNMYYGVQPVLYEHLPGFINTAVAGLYLYNHGYVEENDLLLFVSGEYKPSHHSTNTLQVLSVRDILDYSNNEN